MARSPLKQLGQRLSTCRKQAGLDTSALSARAGLTEEQVRRFEQGHGGLGMVALTRLARTLGVPAATFMHTDVPEARAYKAPTVLLKAERIASLSDPDMEAISRSMERARAFAELGELLKAEHLSTSFVPTPSPQQKSYRAGYKAALEARKLLPEREGALTELRRLIENRFDILVLEHSFTNPAVLGASCRGGAARLIVLRANIDSQAQRRFVLAHELAHHLLDLAEEGASIDEGQVEEAGWWLENPPTEKRANAFAAMFLAPDFAVRKVLGEPRPEGYGLEDAQHLVARGRAAFGISFAAMAWHLLNLKYLKSDETVKTLLSQRSDETLSTELESPSRFSGLERRVFEALENDLLSEERARELLGGPIPPREL